MGTMLLDGVQIGDDGRDAGPDYAWDVVRPKSVMPEVDFDAPARRLAAKLRKSAARRYIRTPGFLDGISLGLSVSPPNRVLAVCAHKAEFGGSPFGALVEPINLAGARLYARWLRRHELHDDVLDVEAEQALIAAE